MNSLNLRMFFSVLLLVVWNAQAAFAFKADLQTLNYYDLHKKIPDQKLKLSVEKPTVLLVWASWCPHCEEMALRLTSLKEFQNKKIDLIGISVDDKLERAEKALKNKRRHFHLFSKNYWNVDFKKEIMIERIVPTVVLFSKDAKIENIYVGTKKNNYRMIPLDIERLLVNSQ
jgi:thiol-disulfide isomerase/thioredoxin